MIIPPYLISGDTIAIAAASRVVDELLLNRAKDFLEKAGFQVVFSPNILAQYHQFAGTDSQRAADINWAISDDNIKAIIFFRGGYGAARILDMVDWQPLLNKPKWFCGYSDVTAIHIHLQSIGIASLHATMPIHIAQTDEESILSFYALIEALKGEEISYYLESSIASYLPIEGELVGGNLSVIYSLLGSVSDFSWAGKVLFIEDIDEYYYHLDRIMNALSRAGKFKKLKALLVGNFKDIKDNTIPFGKNIAEIMQEYALKHNILIFFGMPVGHDKLNIPVKCGLQVKIENDEIKYCV